MTIRTGLQVYRKLQVKLNLETGPNLKSMKLITPAFFQANIFKYCLEQNQFIIDLQKNCSETNPSDMISIFSMVNQPIDVFEYWTSIDADIDVDSTKLDKG